MTINDDYTSPEGESARVSNLEVGKRERLRIETSRQPHSLFSSLSIYNYLRSTIGRQLLLLDSSHSLIEDLDTRHFDDGSFHEHSGKRRGDKLFSTIVLRLFSFHRHDRDRHWQEEEEDSLG